MNNNDEVYVVVLRDEDGLLSTRRIWGYDSFKRGVVGKRGRFTYDGIEIVNFLSGYNFEILEKKARDYIDNERKKALKDNWKYNEKASLEEKL